MEDDSLLRALGERQRDDAAEDDAIVRPFEDAERDAILDGVMGKLGGLAAPQTSEPETPAAAPHPAAAVELRNHNARRGLIAAVVAVAAAALLWFAIRPAPSTELPAYAFTQLNGGTAELRGSDDELPSEVELERNTTIDWVVTPETSVKPGLAAAVLATADDGEVYFAALPGARVSPQGAVRIKGPWSEFFELDPGAWSVSILIGPPDALPADAAAAQAEPSGRWRSVAIRVSVVP